MRKALTCFILIAASAGLAACNDTKKEEAANAAAANEVVTVNETDMNATMDMNAMDANAMVPAAGDLNAAPIANDAATNDQRGDPSNR